MLMKKFLCLLLFAYILCPKNALAQADGKNGVNYAVPQTYTLAAVRVAGDDNLDRGTIINTSGLKTGQNISIPGEDITRAIQNLWRLQLYTNIRILLDSVSANKAYLTINLQSRPKLGKFTFTGVPKSQAKKLSEEVKINTRDIVTEQMLSKITRKVKEYYVAKGYPNAKINIQAKPDTAKRANQVNLVIDVEKGKRTKINDIAFEGTTAFSDKKLRKLMKKTKERQPLNVFRNSKFKTDEYETDKETVLAFYRKNGYKDVQIVQDSTYMVEENRLNINIKVAEGHKYYFRNIQWAGNTKYDSRYLNRILNIKKGDIYNPELLERNLYISQTGLDVTSLYMDDGYLFFSVTPVELLVENDSVDLEIRIFEGPQATINKVTVVGNSKTHDHVILREIRTKPGQKFSRSDIIRSQRELSQLGYFDAEKLGVTPKPNMQDGTVDIEYTVVEKPSDQIELSGGWGGGRLVGVLGLSLNNFSARNMFKPKLWQGYPSGDGQRLSLRAQTNGPQYQSYNMSFTEPWFGGKKPNSFTFSAFYSVQNDRITKNGELANRFLKTPGVSVGLGSRLKWPDDFFTSFLSLSYQYYTFENYTFVPTFSSGFTNNLNARGVLSRNATQGTNPIYPIGGSNVSFQVQATLPYSSMGLTKIGNAADLTPQEKYKWIEYHKWKFDGAYYLPLSNPKKKNVLMLAASTNFGFLGLYNRQLGLAPFERFYVGGDALSGYTLDGRELIRLRGYKGDEDVTPRYKNARTNEDVETGGAIYNRFTFELRYPLLANEGMTFYGLAFVEGGNAWLRFKDYDPFTLKRSAGLGIRAFLPMFGLIGFDVGYGFDKSLLDPTKPSGFQTHFMIGQPLSF
ncbi:MAG: outer membrane protein assembly factor BamA [Sphingobacteriales bacterium]|nr:MAG: outer membrane protein assembly factor BamA [Sphingobacteriales bacterium]